MLADNLATGAFMQVAAGQYEQATLKSQEARQLSRTIGNLWNESYSILTVDLIFFERGEAGPALEVAEECGRLAALAGFGEGITQSMFDRVLILAYMGALPQAFDLARQTLALTGAGAGVAPAAIQIEGLLAMLELRAGRPTQARAMYDAIPMSHDPSELQQQFVLNYIFFTQLQAEMALAGGHAADTLAPIDQLIAHIRPLGVRLFLADMLQLKGRALLAAGRPADGRAALEEARREAESIGSRRSLWSILADLAGLAAERGDEADALALRRQAAEIVDYIAAHAGSAGLAESFLKQPPVQDVLRLATDTRTKG
jgi:hypothetical protein